MSGTTRSSRRLEEIPENWRDFLPETLHTLLTVRKKGGSALALLVAEAIAAEIDRSQKRRVEERTTLLVEVMEGSEDLGYPQLSTELFEVAQGLEAWVAFTTEASVEELRMLREAVGLCKQGLAGRNRLASL